MSTLQPGMWTPLGNNLPRVLSYDLDYDPVDDILLVGTLGRGAWALRAVTTFLITPATVVDRGVFYNSSTGNSGNAFATDKQALLPGQMSTFQNYTNFHLGITGVSLDIKDLPLSLTPAQIQKSLQFAQWNAIDAAGFTALPAGVVPTVTAVQAGAGAGGSSRVLITFPNNSLRNTWLRITVNADSTNILAQNDVFYFGNVVGDVNVGNTTTRLRVNAEDTATIRLNQSPLPGSATATNIYDINRDGRVDAQDTFLVRSNQQPLGIVAPLNAPGSTGPSRPVRLAGPFVPGMALVLPTFAGNQIRDPNFSVGSSGYASKSNTWIVAPEPAPAFELQSTYTTPWYLPLEKTPLFSAEVRKRRLVDDYFATFESNLIAISESVI
jgi:hypothetical protein